MEAIARAIGKSGYRLGEDVLLALDVADSELFDKKTSAYELDGKSIDRKALVDLYDKWSRDFPIVSIEDGFAEDDWEGWKLLTDRLGARGRLGGDALFPPSPPRLRRGVRDGLGNAVLLKVNQS